MTIFKNMQVSVEALGTEMGVLGKMTKCKRQLSFF